MEAVKIVNIVAVKKVASEFPWDSVGRADNIFRQKSTYVLLSALPFVASFVEAANIVNIVAVNTIANEFPWDSLRRADTKFS